MNVLDSLRAVCLAFPGAYEKVAWSAPTFRVGDRQFAMFADDHHGVGFAGVWLKAMPDSEVDEAALFRALFASAADAILVVDGSGRVVLANAACGPLLGCDPASLRGRSVETLVPERFAGHARQRERYATHPSARAMGRGLQLFARRADGRDIPVDISLSPFTLAGRSFVSCALRDQRSLSHGPDTLRVQATALRSAANGVVITDRAGTITWVNPAACAITGYSSDELVGQHTRLLKSGRHEPGFYANLWETVLRGESWSGTIVNRRKDGSEYQEEQAIAPVLDESGVITHFIAIKQDVTEQRRIQDELARAHRDRRGPLQAGQRRSRPRGRRPRPPAAGRGPARLRALLGSRLPDRRRGVRRRPASTPRRAPAATASPRPRATPEAVDLLPRRA